jgi:YceI-like domain
MRPHSTAFLNNCKLLCVLFLCFTFGNLSRAQPRQSPGTQTSWALKQSTLTYHVSHPLHQIAGVSHDARGKGDCQQGQCSFLIAAPVKSFSTGDTNRDLHMLQATRGAEFPMIVVRTVVPESALKSSEIHADLEVQFAGQTATYKQVPFPIEAHGNEIHVAGTIPCTVSDFKITPPELLFVPIKDQIPVSVDMTWQRQE